MNTILLYFVGVAFAIEIIRLYNLKKKDPFEGAWALLSWAVIFVVLISKLTKFLLTFHRKYVTVLYKMLNKRVGFKPKVISGINWHETRREKKRKRPLNLQ